MKCEVCLELLEEYLDGELAAQEQSQVGEHLITCADCAANFAVLTAEQKLFARYDRELEVSPFLWTRVAAHTVSESASRRDWRRRFAGFFTAPLAGTIAVLLLVIAIGLVYVVSRKPQPNANVAGGNRGKPVKVVPNEPAPMPHDSRKPELVASQPKPKRRAASMVNATVDHASVATESDVLSSDLAYLDIDDRDTAKHIEQTQNLLRSIRNVPISDGDEEIDVTYDKALSRRLLNENVVLRRDAEMKAKFPTKTLLADLEPFLIDIANLPDHARAEDLRVIKERVQRTEIVAALVDYQDRGTNNR